MSHKFVIVKGNPSEQEMAALEKAIPIPVEKKVESASLWRKSQIRQPLPKKWGPTF